MKILVITKKFPYPFIDGESIAINSLIKGLAGNGLDIDLFALNTTKHYYAFKSKGRPEELSYYNRIYTADIDNGIKPLSAFFNLFSSWSYHVSRYYHPHVSETLSLLLEENDYDIIQLEGLQLMVYYDVIKKVSNAPIILRAHNQEYLIWHRLIAHQNSGLKRIYLKIQQRKLKRFEILAAQKVDVIFSISEVDTDWFKMYNDHVFTVPIGTPLDSGNTEIELWKNTDHLMIGFIGSLDWLPNLEGLKLFMEKVHQVDYDANRPYKLIIAGRNSTNSNLQLPKGNDIDYLGEIEDAELFWNKIDLLIVPLLSGSGVRIKILEAMSRRKIVLTTSIGVEGIPAEKGQEVIIEDELESWPSILDRINKDRSAYHNMRSKAKTLIEQHYDENLIAARAVEYYRSIIKEYS